MDTLKGLWNDPSQFYANLHTTVNTGGAIRGQLMLAETTVVMAQLSPANEVPPIAIDASGVGTAITHVTRDGNVRTDVGDLISVIVNSSEHRVMTLHHPAHVATLAPLVVPATSDDAMAWLKEIREFQGEAKALPQPRMIGYRKAYGWELETAAGKIVLWATEDGLPLKMTLGGSAAMQLDFDFAFDPASPAQTFSTEIPAGYSLAKEED